MWMNLISLFFIALLTYVWVTRGFFSAFIHMLCTLAAGAIAFAVWEPLAYLLVSTLPSDGFLRFLQNVAWPAALILPFAASLALLRVAFDQIVRANVTNATPVDWIGGGVCGLIASGTTVGLIVIALSFGRFDTGFLGYRPVWYTEARATGSGSLERKQAMWVPVDRMVARFYGRLSETTLRSGEPLGRWYPDLELAGFAGRMSMTGRTRVMIRPEDFRVLSSYTVGDPEQGESVRDLLVDQFDQVPQGYVDLDGNPVSRGYLAGYVIEFGPGAREDTGQFIISNGPVRLVAERGGERRTIHPVAAIAQASADDALSFTRARFDSDEVEIPSVGGASQVPIAFEFVIPEGFRPIGLYVRNTRVRLDRITDEPTRFANHQARDAQVVLGTLLREGRAVTDLNRSEARRVTEEHLDTAGRLGNEAGVNVSTALGRILQTTQARGRGLTLDDSNRIVSGDASFRPDEFETRAGLIPRNLRVDQIGVLDDQVLVQLDVSGDKLGGLIHPASRTADQNQPPMLIDTDGTPYQALGFIYQDRDVIRVRVEPGNPIRRVVDMPSLSAAAPERRLTILFVVSRGVEIETYAIGDKAILTFDPPLDTVRR